MKAMTLGQNATRERVRIAALKRSHADLLAALEGAVDVMKRSQPHKGGYTDQRLQAALAAITKAKEPT